MPLTFEKEFTVYNFECGPFGRMSPGAALRRIQEISIAHSSSVGVGDEVYRTTGAIFLLSRVSLAMHHMPVEGQRVRMQTRAYGMRRALFYRVTGLYAEDGALLCEADSRWLLVDIASRRILRRPPEGFPMPFIDTDVGEEHGMKLPRATDPLREVWQGQAGYTLCDTNGHVNNARYADMVMDALPLERLRKGDPERMLLVYHHEIPLGESFASFVVQQPGGYYFTARSGDRNNFEAFAWL